MVSEYEAHLDSYDHGHKKRLREFQQMSRLTNRTQVQRREKARDEEELVRRIAAAAAAKAPAAGSVPPVVAPAVPAAAAPVAVSTPAPAPKFVFKTMSRPGARPSAPP
jgi:hypothetical protein